VRVQRLAVIVVLGLMIFPMFGGSVSAHHSVAGYDTQKQVALKGTVVEFNWRNPHVFIIWAVKDESGKVVNWTAEMSAPTTMMQLGMKRDSLKPGDEIIAYVNPSKTNNPLGLIRKINAADGKLIVDRVPER
jgi:hypothetical protein